MNQKLDKDKKCLSLLTIVAASFIVLVWPFCREYSKSYCIVYIIYISSIAITIVFECGFDKFYQLLILGKNNPSPAYFFVGFVLFLIFLLSFLFIFEEITEWTSYLNNSEISVVALGLIGSFVGGKIWNLMVKN